MVHMDLQGWADRWEARRRTDHPELDPSARSIPIQRWQIRLVNLLFLAAMVTFWGLRGLVLFAVTWVLVRGLGWLLMRHLSRRAGA
jgi:hypothetical protein